MALPTPSLSANKSIRSQHGEQDPPQSIPVSSPFSFPSTHVGASQAPFRQTSLVQSEGFRQPAPVEQRGHVGPPQSIPVSALFFLPSSHVGN